MQHAVFCSLVNKLDVCVHVIMWDYALDPLLLFGVRPSAWKYQNEMLYPEYLAYNYIQILNKNDLLSYNYISCDQLGCCLQCQRSEKSNSSFLQCLPELLWWNSLMRSFNRGNIERTNSWKNYVWYLCMCVLFYVCEVIGFVDWSDKRFIYIYIWEEFWNVLMSLRWPCVVDRILKSTY